MASRTVGEDFSGGTPLVAITVCACFSRLYLSLAHCFDTTRNKTYSLIIQHGNLSARRIHHGNQPARYSAKDGKHNRNVSMPEHNLGKVSQHLVEGSREIRRTQKVSRMRSCIIRNDIRRIAAECVRYGQHGLPFVSPTKLFYSIKQFLYASQHLGL